MIMEITGRVPSVRASIIKNYHALLEETFVFRKRNHNQKKSLRVLLQVMGITFHTTSLSQVARVPPRTHHPTQGQQNNNNSKSVTLMTMEKVWRQNTRPILRR